MIRIVKLSNQYYGYKIDSIEDDLENIEYFVNDYDLVILVNELDDLEKLDINVEDVEMVEAE